MSSEINYVPTIYVDDTRCEGRMACMRVCPTYAIRVKRGKARIINDLCIDCGECIKACPNKAIKPIMSSFHEIKSIESIYVIASPALYAQFKTDIHPYIIHEGLRRMGFADSFDITQYCVIGRKATERFILESKGEKPIISSHCPVIVSLIEIQYPSLTEHLLAIREPREIAAMDLKKKIQNKGAKVIYITPCSAKMIDVKSPRWKEKSFIDGTLSIRDIYNPLLSTILDIKAAVEPRFPIYSEGIEWAIEGGIINHLSSTILTLSSSGISNAKKILSDIESNRLRGIDFVEIYACDSGCCGGSLAVENTYMARNKVRSLINLPIMVREASFDISNYELERKWLGLRSVTDSNIIDLPKAIQKVKEKESIYAKLPKIDCGLCGCPTCQVFAEDVAQGNALLGECIMQELNQIKNELNAIFQRWRRE